MLQRSRSPGHSAATPGTTAQAMGWASRSNTGQTGCCWSTQRRSGDGVGLQVKHRSNRLLLVHPRRSGDGVGLQVKQAVAVHPAAPHLPGLYGWAAGRGVANEHNGVHLRGQRQGGGVSTRGRWGLRGQRQGGWCEHKGAVGIAGSGNDSCLRRGHLQGQPRTHTGGGGGHPHHQTRHAQSAQMLRPFVPSPHTHPARRADQPARVPALTSGASHCVRPMSQPSSL